MPAADDAADDLALIREAAREAGRIAMRYFKAKPEVWWKGQSPVSEADFAVDRYLREALTAARPGYGWLSEETLDTPERLGARRTFVVDPIDGTRAFLDGNSTWCVSIAVVEAGRPLAGVLDCPAKDEIFAATPGRGATMNGAPIAVSRHGGAPHVSGPKQMLDALPADVTATMRRGSYVPSLAYRVAMVANGSLDATFVKPNSHDWDLAAADLILGEAGGSIRNAEGERLTYAGPDPVHGALAAGSGALLDMLVDAIARAARQNGSVAVPKPVDLL